MAYLHCHTKDCNWSQDDWYSWKYNPITKIWSDIKWLWKPRMVEWDSGFINWDAKDLQKYTGVKIKFKGNACFSWSWLWLEIVKNTKNFFNQRWWTYKSWKKDMDKGTATCPKCGKICFDID